MVTAESGAARQPQPIPESHRDLFDKRAFAHIATLMPNGTPQVTPMWVMLQDGLVVVNSAKGRQKDRNMRGRRRVALSVQDPDNPYRYIGMRGIVVEITEEGADDVINQLSEKYTGNPVYQGRRPGEVRVTYKIRPDHIWTMG
ncbi:MAG: PPOX class F420-dependent oxidoreductase [Chloroflexi bacterium]|nr:PPOX class F420-dependent oxidoreductase [Chloroflexota bacterium]